MKLTATLTVLCLSLSFGLANLAEAGVLPQKTAPRAEVMQMYGHNAGRGNLLGAQPFLRPTDFANAGRFLARMDEPLARAKAKGWINRKTIVLYPEAIGLFLMAANERPEVYTAPGIEGAIAAILKHHSDEIARRKLPKFKVDPASQGVRITQELKAPLMARIYQSTFAKLARRYRATIVAGSIMLPGAAVRHGTLVTDITKPVQNVCAVFNPAGRIYPDLVRKAFPIVQEVVELGVVRANLSSLPVFPTPAGRLGVVICADAWFPETYRVLESKGVDILAVPALAKPMGDKWPGYSLSGGFDAPAGVDSNDIGKLSIYDATAKYAMPGRLREAFGRKTAIHQGMTVFARGSLWDEATTESAPFVSDHGKFITWEYPGQAPSLVCYWLQ